MIALKKKTKNIRRIEAMSKFGFRVNIPKRKIKNHAKRAVSPMKNFGPFGAAMSDLPTQIAFL